MDSSILLKIYLGTLFLYEAVAGYNTCNVGGGYVKYCENGCCSVGGSTYCCLTTYMIVGIVFGCIAALCSIIAIVICIFQQKKRSGQVLGLSQQPTSRVMVVSSQNHTVVHPPNYTPVYPLSPGYANPYNTNPSNLPQYSSNNQPPPPYSYNPPPTNAPELNPFAAAANEANNNSKK